MSGQILLYMEKGLMNFLRMRQLLLGLAPLVQELALQQVEELHLSLRLL
jgi:hypothetical protein